MDAPIVFLDTSAIFAAIISPVGGGRALLQLGELHAMRLFAGPTTLLELETVIRRKSPNALPKLALVLAQANFSTGPKAHPDQIATLHPFLDYLPDVEGLAAAIATKCAFFVTLDRKHFLDNARLRQMLPMPLGTPGDCLAWYRMRFTRPPAEI